MKNLPILLFVICGSNALINQSWKSLESQVQIRYFSPERVYESNDPNTIWFGMGVNISCSVQDDNDVKVIVPPEFDSRLPIKAFTHGFSSTAIDDNTAFVNAWMNRYDKKIAVILVDWQPLALPRISDWKNKVYDRAAGNSIDVGQFLGTCLAELSKSHGVDASDIHMVGHSLGAQVMGKAGDTYKQIRNEKIGRITGLDPAGARFFDGKINNAIPELASNRLNVDSAAFVDIIHTNGGFRPCVVCQPIRLGALHQMGHMDFYPGGGSVQYGCTIGPDWKPGVCSHVRATHYYINSIREPFLFPSRACSSVEKCNNKKAASSEVVSYMGEDSIKYWDGESRSLNYLKITECHWTHYLHNDKKFWGRCR